MALNLSEKMFFEKLASEQANNPPGNEMTLEAFKAMPAELLSLAGEAEDIPFEDRSVPVRDGTMIPIRLFNPGLEASSPVLFMFPSGGYCLNFFEATAISASRIAKHAGIRTVVVDYRLQPEHPMPQPSYDGYDVVKYIAMHPDEFQINPSRIFVSGLSSGGHCSAFISNMQRQDDDFSVYHQILVNAWLDLARTNKEFKKEELEDAIATPEALEDLYQIMDLPREQFTDPLISPHYEKDLSNQPKTTLLIAEHDGIRGDSEAYYQRLVEAGNEVERILLPGQTHCTMILREALCDGKDPAIVIADVVKRSLA